MQEGTLVSFKQFLGFLMLEMENVVIICRDKEELVAGELTIVAANAPDEDSE